MIINVKTLVFCENFEYGDVHVMNCWIGHGDTQSIIVYIFS